MRASASKRVTEQVSRYAMNTALAGISRGVDIRAGARQSQPAIKAAIESIAERIARHQTAGLRQRLATLP